MERYCKKEEIFKLMQKNPDLPVIPLIDYEIVGEDNGCRLGEWGSIYVGEYLIAKGRSYFREDNSILEVERLLSDLLGDEEYEAMSDEDAQKIYAEMPWTKAIIVNIVNIDLSDEND